jgi:hypothetical protein
VISHSTIGNNASLSHPFVIRATLPLLRRSRTAIAGAPSHVRLGDAVLTTSDAIIAPPLKGIPLHRDPAPINLRLDLPYAISAPMPRAEATASPWQ